MLPVETAFKIYTGLDGKPLDGGYVYFGQPNQNPITAPVTVYWDAAGTQPAAPPLRTENGYIVRSSGGTPANVFYSGAYSQIVRDKNQRQVYFARTSDDYSIATIVQNFISNLAASAGSTLIGYIQAGTGAIARTIQDRLREKVSVKDFGAVCDGVTDDTVAVQAAVNYCLSASQARALEVPGKCLLTAPIIINRLVDTTSSKFYIIGKGAGAGFVVSSAIEMFSTTLPFTNDPVSERVRFERIRFESTNVSLAAYVLNKGFLRIEFYSCEFLAIRLVNSNIYLQDAWFTDCRINSVPSNFITVDGLYNVCFSGGSVKFGGTLVSNVSTARGTNGLHFSDGFLAEGASASLVRANGATMSVIGCHFELNFMPTFNLFVGGPDNGAITVVGNYIYNGGGSDGIFYYGATASVHSAGNTQFGGGYLHKQTSSVAVFTSVADNTAGLSDQVLSTSIGGIKTNVGISGLGTAPEANNRLVVHGPGTTAATTALIVRNNNGLDTAVFFDDRNARFYGNVGYGVDPISASRIYSRGIGTGSGTFSFVALNGDGQDVMHIQDDKAVKLFGAFGCNGATPQGATLLPAAAVDAATTQALANSMRSLLIANGLAS